MSLCYPVKKVYITQPWGVNQHIYSKFGLKGHNGIDFRAFLPNGERCYEGGKSEIFAPHDGEVIENWFDGNGYGWLVKIENNKEGSILAHMSHKSPLKPGQKVKAGDFVGYQGTTGFSTGIHLHWGYYPKPRNKANGYSGTVNQLLLEIKHLSELNKTPEKDDMSNTDRELRNQYYNNLMEIRRSLGLKDRDLGDRPSVQEVTKKVDQLNQEIKDLHEEINKLVKQPATGIVRIDREVPVAGIVWEINGIQIDSEGKITANYAKK